MSAFTIRASQSAHDAGLLRVVLAAAAAWGFACAPEPPDAGCRDSTSSAVELPSSIDQDVREHLEPLVRAADALPSDAEARKHLGRALIANGLLIEARVTLLEAACLDPGDPLPAYYAALAAENTGDPGTAREELARIAARHREFAPAHHRLGRLLLAAGLDAGAREAFETASRLAPRDAAPRIGLADAALRVDDPDAALIHADAALELAPGLPAARYMRGRALRDAGRLDEARGELARLGAAKDVSVADAWAPLVAREAADLTGRLAHASELLGAARTDEALAVLEALRARRPDEPLVLGALSSALRRTGRAGAAAELLSEAHARGVETPALASRHALALADAGRLDDAVVRALDAVRLDSRDARVHLVAGDLLRRRGRLSEAEQTLRRGIELDPDHVELRVVLGETLISAGDANAALIHLAYAAERAPSRWAVHARVAQLHVALGDTVAAREALARARAAAPNRPELDALERELSLDTGSPKP